MCVNHQYSPFLDICLTENFLIPTETFQCLSHLKLWIDSLIWYSAPVPNLPPDHLGAHDITFDHTQKKKCSTMCPVLCVEDRLERAFPCYSSIHGSDRRPQAGVRRGGGWTWRTMHH